MNESPETRHSLLARLHEPRDEQAWREFEAIYQPLIYRLIRGRGHCRDEPKRRATFGATTNLREWRHDQTTRRAPKDVPRGFVTL